MEAIDPLYVKILLKESMKSFGSWVGGRGGGVGWGEECLNI